MAPDTQDPKPFILHASNYFIPKFKYSALRTKMSMHWYRAIPSLKDHSCETDFPKVGPGGEMEITSLWQHAPPRSIGNQQYCLPQ